VRNFQLAYCRHVTAHVYAGLSIGKTSYRQQVEHAYYDVNLKPITTAHASMRYAEVAIPVKVEGSYVFHFKRSRVFINLNTGVVVCTGSKGVSPYYYNPSNAPDPVVYGYSNTTAFTAGASSGFDHFFGKHFGLGICPALNYIHGKFVPANSTASTESSFIDVQLRLVGTFAF
jgi:hypothetical protein